MTDLVVHNPLEARSFELMAERWRRRDSTTSKITERLLQVYQSQQKRQNKQAEIDFFERELIEGVWEDSESQLDVRRRQLQLLKPFLSKNPLILDAACGPGTYGIILAQEGNEVIGIDISFEAARVAKERAKKKRCNFSPIAADLERLPFSDNSFDICFFGYALHHFPNIAHPLADIFRILKPESKIALMEPNGSNPLIILSGRIENLIRGLLSSLGLDTSNERLYGVNQYVEELVRQGYTNVEVISHYFGGLPPFPVKSKKRGLHSLSFLLIHILVHLRRLLFIIGNRVLPRPLNGADLLITGAKGVREMKGETA